MVRRGGSLGYSIAFVALVAALGVAGSLVYLLIARPISEPAGVTVSEAVAEDCPVGERAPVCYRFDVTNTGDETGAFSCQAYPPPDSLAVFQNGEPRDSVILQPGQTQTVLIKVTPLETDEVTTPGLECTPPPG
jgi:hypothetical protein